MSSGPQDPRDLLVSTISNLHKSGAYSDLKIICGSDTYNVHKNIICPQSNFFRAACRPDTFKEGQTGIITLSANPGREVNAQSSPITPDEFDWELDVENTKTVSDMIYYFYHHDYQTEENSAFRSPPLGEHLSEGALAQHARMYAMGEKYGDMRNKIIKLFLMLPALMKFDLIDKTLRELPDLVYALLRGLLDEKINQADSMI
ncbi:hypothetical protein QM012_003450 [Aureobasidium pullulans]|uniref:BTB domain-containing protein n=1 Tax=Aureobasidium pullulans TaxID=5580 RepID=A0ABR0T9S1_AURPU